MAFEDLLNTTVVIERKNPTRDVSGGQVENFTSTLVMPALIQPRKGSVEHTQGQRHVVVSHVIYIQDGSGIHRGDQVFHPESGRRYVVHGVEDMAGQHRCWRIECRETT